MTKLTDAEKDKLDNTCGNLRVTKLGTHVKSLEDFVNEGVLATRANDVTSAINELYGMIVNNECAEIQIPPPGFFTIFGNDEDGKLYVYYNDEEHPPVFRHVETEGELEGTLYLYIADPEGENHFEMEIGHYIAVKHLDNYYTKAEIDAGYAIKNHAVNASTYGLGSTSKFGHVKTINGLTQASHADGLALSAYQGKVLKTAVDEKVVTVEKQSTAESGYSATYIVKQNNAQVGVKINIPKDFLVKSTSVKTCTTANQPVNGYEVGDIYIDWVVNSKDNTATDEHLYLRAKDIGSYPPDEVTLTIENNQFKIKDGGVGSTQLASDSVLTAKIKDANVTTAKIKDGNVTTAKIKDGNVTTAKIADSNVTTAKIADGAVTNDKVTSITKNKISDFSHAHGNLQNDGKVGTTDNANKNVVTDGNGKITTEAKPVVVDAVEEGNINAVSSNAVYDYVGDVSKEIPVKTYQQFISLIARAEDGDVIVLDADYNFSKTGLTYYLVGIGKSLTIFGNGHRIFTENDEDTYFILRSGIDNKTTLAFYDTIFTNLKSDEFLFATDNQYWPYSELIFDNCMFINNSAKGICDGALGDYSNDPGEADKEAKVTIRNCTFKNNKTTYGTLFFKYDSSVINSIFTANSASTTGYGGAIHRVSGNVSVVDCEFNTTTDTVVGVTPTDSIQQKIDTSIAGKIDTAGAGLTKEGTTLKHSNSVTAQTSAVLKKIKYDAQGHITGVGNVGKSDITALGIPGQDTTYSTATQSDNGLMSSTDKTKLDGIATGANKITVDSTLSTTSTNPVQNKVINNSLGNKVDKVSGKGLSTNDFTDDLKTKLDGIATGANKITVDSTLSTTSTNPVQNKIINAKISTLATKEEVDDIIAGDVDLTGYVKDTDSRLSDSRTPKFNLINASSTNLKDLDDYVTGGFYYCNNDGNIAPYISNCPLTGSSNKSFFLLVETWGETGSNYVKQTLTYYHNNVTYVRTKAGSKTGWVAWRKTTEVAFNPTKTTGIEVGTLTINGVATKIYQQDTTYSTANESDDGLMSSSDKIKLDGINMDTKSDVGHTHKFGDIGITQALPANSDLDTLLTQGFYTCTSANSATLANKPFIGNQTTLIENKNFSGGSLVQTVYGLSTYTMVAYARTYTSSKWSSWRHLGGTNSVAIPATITVDGETVNNDLNNYKQEGLFTCGSASTTTIDNLPFSDKRAFYLRVIDYRVANYIVQILFPITSTDSNNKIYYRIMFGKDVWVPSSGWNTVATVDDIPTKLSQLTNDLSKSIVNNNIADNTIELGKLNANSVADSTSGGTSGSSKLATSGALYSGLSNKVDTTDSRLSDARTPTSHSHGSITNDGKVGTTANKPLITGTGGLVKVGSFGTTANTFCQGNDSRLSDSRTPTSHTHGNIDNSGIISGANTKNVVTDSNGKITTEDKYTHPSYTARTGVPTDDYTLAFGGRFNVSQPVSDTSGHVTAINKRWYTLPTLPTADTSTAGITKLVNDLTTGGTDKALTAEQGKSLNNKVIAITDYDTSSVTTIRDSFVTSGWSGTVRYYVKNGWCIVTYEGLQKTSTTSSYDALINNIGVNNAMGSDVFANTDLSVYMPVMVKVNQNGVLLARCVKANTALYGSLIFPI